MPLRQQKDVLSKVQSYWTKRRKSSGGGVHLTDRLAQDLGAALNRDDETANRYQVIVGSQDLSLAVRYRTGSHAVLVGPRKLQCVIFRAAPNKGFSRESSSSSVKTSEKRPIRFEKSTDMTNLSRGVLEDIVQTVQMRLNARETEREPYADALAKSMKAELSKRLPAGSTPSSWQVVVGKTSFQLSVEGPYAEGYYADIRIGSALRCVAWRASYVKGGQFETPTASALLSALFYVILLASFGWCLYLNQTCTETDAECAARQDLGVKVCICAIVGVAAMRFLVRRFGGKSGTRRAA